jgi:hypothetical protein
MIGGLTHVPIRLTESEGLSSASLVIDATELIFSEAFKGGKLTGSVSLRKDESLQGSSYQY